MKHLHNVPQPTPSARGRLRRGISQPRRSYFSEGGRIVLAIILGMAVAHAFLHATGLVLVPQ